MLKILSCLLLASAILLGISTAASAQVGSQISSAQLGKVIAMLNQSGKEIPLDLNVTDALGLTKGGAKISPRQVAVQDEGGLIHAFIRLEKGAGYLLGRVADVGVLVIQVGPELQLRRAILKAPGGTKTAAIPTPDAQKRLDEELRYWAKFADDL